MYLFANQYKTQGNFLSKVRWSLERLFGKYWNILRGKRHWQNMRSYNVVFDSSLIPQLRQQCNCNERTHIWINLRISLLLPRFRKTMRESNFTNLDQFFNFYWLLNSGKTWEHSNFTFDSLWCDCSIQEKIWFIVIVQFRQCWRSRRLTPWQPGDFYTIYIWWWPCDMACEWDFCAIVQVLSLHNIIVNLNVAKQCTCDSTTMVVMWHAMWPPETQFVNVMVKFTLC